MTADEKSEKEQVNAAKTMMTSRKSKRGMSTDDQADEKNKMVRSVVSAPAAAASEQRIRTPGPRRRTPPGARRRMTFGGRFVRPKQVRTPQQQESRRISRQNGAEKDTFEKAEKKREKRRELRRETLMHMRVEELKERCRRAGLPDVGVKAVLADALQAHEIRTKGRVGESNDAKRIGASDVLANQNGEMFTLDDVRVAEQVASSNMKELEQLESPPTQVAEWLEQFEEIEEEVVASAVDREARELRPRRGHRL